MYKVLHLSLGRRPECWFICGLWVCFLPSWLKLELLDTLLYLKGHLKSGKPLHCIERVNSSVWETPTHCPRGCAQEGNTWRSILVVVLQQWPARSGTCCHWWARRLQHVANLVLESWGVLGECWNPFIHGLCEAVVSLASWSLLWLIVREYLTQYPGMLSQYVCVTSYLLILYAFR